MTQDTGARTEPELVAEVDLCTPDGALNPAAIGWTRQPMHRANLRGWGRSKRWEYWCVQTPTHLLALTVSSIDYLALHTVWFLELGGEEIEKTAIVPLPRGPLFSDRSGGGPVQVSAQGVRIGIMPTDSGVLLRARTDRVRADIEVLRPPAHESLGVVIPWSDRRFQYTVKDNTLPARGAAVVDGQTFLFDEGDSWAVLDHGRGRWPYRTTWNWGSGSGISDSRTVGLQFGGKWTEGTGMTENALCVGGRLTKIHGELDWDYDPSDWLRPWRVRSVHSDQVDVTLTPEHERASNTQAVVLASEVHQCFGRWDGRIRTDDGSVVEVEGLRGFAEEAQMRW